MVKWKAEPENQGKRLCDKFLIIIPKSGKCLPIKYSCDEVSKAVCWLLLKPIGDDLPETCTTEIRVYCLRLQ